MRTALCVDWKSQILSQGYFLYVNHLPNPKIIFCRLKCMFSVSELQVSVWKLRKEAKWIFLQRGTHTTQSPICIDFFQRRRCRLHIIFSPMKSLFDFLPHSYLWTAKNMSKTACAVNRINVSCVSSYLVSTKLFKLIWLSDFRGTPSTLNSKPVSLCLFTQKMQGLFLLI